MRIYLLAFVIGLWALTGPVSWAQTKPQPKPAPAKPAGPPRTPPQYVMKKDFDARMEELEGKVRSAVSAGASARGAVNNVYDSTKRIGAKVVEIENTLNSTNFQTMLNSDSLKLAQSKLDAIKLESEKNNAQLQAQISSLSSTLNILLALCIALPLIVGIVLFLMLKKAKEAIRDTANRVNSDVQKNYLAQQDEMKQLKTSVQGDVYSAKTEFTHKLNEAKTQLQAQILAVAEAQQSKADDTEA